MRESNGADAKRVDVLTLRYSPIIDAKLEMFLATEALDPTATIDLQEARVGANCMIIADPNNYDADTNKFDTSSVEAVIRLAIAANRCKNRA